MPEKSLFEVIFKSEGVCVGKLRNEVTSSAVQPFQVTRMLATDEGVFQGGDDTAPTPLEFFLTGLVGCLMTQIRVFGPRLKINLQDLTVNCSAHWEALPDEVGPYHGRPVGFEIDIDVKSDAPTEQVEKLINAARRGCFVEQTLKQANDIKHRLRLNNADWTELH